MTDPLYRIDELRAAESAAAQRLPAGELMRRAGAAAASIIDRRLPRAAEVVVCCGPGNNGGDGYVTALALQLAGHTVRCVAPGGAPTAADAAAAHGRWIAAGGAVLDRWADGQHIDAAVDALFGIGMARPLAGIWRDSADWLSAQRAPVYALDVPSGLDADSGAWLGGVAGVYADATITFLGDKPGLHTGDGCDAAGSVAVETLDVDLPQAQLELVTPDAFTRVCLPRRRNTHKGRFGDLAVIGGAIGMIGAPIIAARAGLHLGAGRVFVDCIGVPEFRFDPVQPELMFRPFRSLASPAAITIGCGLGTGPAAQAALAWALDSDAALVIDADGLNLLAQTGRAPLRPAGSPPPPTVLTPHPLEAARLLGCTADEIQSDRIHAAQRLAQQTGAVVVLKGAGSVIATPAASAASTRRATGWINPTGTPALASAGTGDALAGMLGALLAQGFDAVEATLAAVWLHGAAADDYAKDGGDCGLVAGAVAPAAVRVLARLRGQIGQADRGR